MYLIDEFVPIKQLIISMDQKNMSGSLKPTVSQIAAENYTAKFLRYIDIDNFIKNIEEHIAKANREMRSHVVTNSEKRLKSIAKSFDLNEILYEFEISNRTQSWKLANKNPTNPATLRYDHRSCKCLLSPQGRLHFKAKPQQSNRAFIHSLEGTAATATSPHTSNQGAQ